MTLPVAFHRAARAEFIEAAAWYETQRADLGVAFIAEIERCVALVAEQPQIYAVLHKDIRRVTAERFPYSVYFRAEAQRIVILAVFHGRRDPTVWQRRA
jgi:plasmid stabilization system protein ParE